MYLSPNTVPSMTVSTSHLSQLVRTAVPVLELEALGTAAQELEVLETAALELEAPVVLLVLEELEPVVQLGQVVRELVLLLVVLLVVLLEPAVLGRELVPAVRTVVTKANSDLVVVSKVKVDSMVDSMVDLEASMLGLGCN